MRLEQAIKSYDDAVASLVGCSDGYCVIKGKSKGQHTNGGCRCPGSEPDKYKLRRLLQAAREMRDAIDGK